MTGLVATLTVALALHPAQADVEPLKWKLKAGDTFYLRSKSSMEQTVSAAGTTQDQKTENSGVDQFKVLKAGAAGYTLEQTVLRSETETNVIPGGLGDFDKNMEGLKLTYVLDKDFKVTKFEGYDALKKKLTEGNPAAKAFVDNFLPESAMKKTVEDIFRTGAGKGTKVGDAWKDDETTPLGPNGDLVAKLDYKYAGSKDGVEEVTYTGTARLNPPKDPPADSPVKIVKADLKSDKYTGTILFDRKAGRAKQIDTAMSLKGTMTLSAGGMEIEAEIKSKATGKVEVLDKNPISN